MSSVLSCSAFSHFHAWTAVCADCVSKGLPPLTSMDLTVPLACTSTSSFTVPLRLMVRANGGYKGVTLLTILRVLTLGSSCAKHTFGWTTTPNVKSINSMETFILRRKYAKPDMLERVPKQ